MERFPNWAQSPTDTLLHLAPLNIEESVSVVNYLLHPNNLQRPWLETLAERAGGIPFYVEEIIKVLIEGGAVRQDEAGLWTLTDADKPIEVPDTIMATVAARLDKLPMNEKTLLQQAAIVGERFWESSLAFPRQNMEADGMMTLWNTVQKEWAFEREVSGFEGDREFAFANALARDVAYAGLTRARRGREHRRVGEWLECRVGERVEEFIETLAHHFAQTVPSDLGSLGDDFEAVMKAIQYGWVAAERSRLRQSYRDASERFTKVLQWVRDLTFLEDGPREVYDLPLDLLEMRLSLAHAATLEPLGEYEAALKLLIFVHEAAAERGLKQLEGMALVQKARILRIQGDLAAAESATDTAAELLAASGDDAGQAQAKIVLGEIFSDQAKLADFEAACRQAIDLARGSSAWVEARGLTLLGTACVYQGRVEEAHRYVGQAVEAYREMADRRGRATSLITYGRIQHMRGEMEQAISAIHEAVLVFEELGDHRSLASASFALGLIRFEQGDLPGARSAAELGLSHASAINEAAMRIRSLLLLSQVENESGLYPDALTHLHDAEEMCLNFDQKSVLPEIYRTLGMAYWGTGQLDEAERCARKGREVVTEDDHYSQGTTWLVLARVLSAAGKTDEGESAFIQGLDAIEESEEQYEIGMGHE
ncbi:MAG: tetratricopeptide repeat protein, partial [Chloroflexi bacterium]|nr:tetratricopeptide repeat protein [Chloroflexota bacterium]